MDSLDLFSTRAPSVPLIAPSPNLYIHLYSPKNGKEEK